MDTSDNVGADAARELFVCDADLLGRVLGENKWCGSCAWYVGSGAFNALVKAISKGDNTTEDTLLRLWGVR